MNTRTEQRQQIARARIARRAAAELEAYLDSESGTEDAVLLASEQMVWLPRRSLELLVEVLDALGEGRDPAVLPLAKELGTGEVADLLGVSRQYVVRLLDDGLIPCRRVGNRRRIQISDAIRYWREDKRRRVGRFEKSAD